MQICNYRTVHMLDFLPVHALCVSHLYFSHHVVVRLHVHGEGFPHLSLPVVQNLYLDKVLLLALLELHILDTDSKVSVT